MKLYGGIDLHSNNSVINLIDENSEVLIRKRMANSLDAIVMLLMPYRDGLVGLVVESTYNWYWLVDGLMDAGFEVHLANTAAIQQYSGLKHGGDDSDANWLANMLRLGILPEGYIYPKEERMLRDLLRKRLQLVQQKTQNLLSIQGLYDRHLNRRLNSNKIKQLSLEQLTADFADPNVCMAVNGNLAILQCLTLQIKTVVAKKAVAHKLARACFYVLRDQLEFDVNKAFGYSKKRNSM
jgi:transposase